MNFTQGAWRWRAESRQGCSCLEGSAVEVSVHHELLDGPPGRVGIGDVVAPAFWHPTVESTDHMTLAIEDERA